MHRTVRNKARPYLTAFIIFSISIVSAVTFMVMNHDGAGHQACATSISQTSSVSRDLASCAEFHVTLFQRLSHALPQMGGIIGLVLVSILSFSLARCTDRDTFYRIRRRLRHDFENHRSYFGRRIGFWLALHEKGIDPQHLSS